MKSMNRCSILLLLCFLICESCSSIKIVTKYDCNTVVNNPVNKKTKWVFAWGLIPPKDIDPKCEQAFNHLNKVEVKTNLGFILISTITLGAVIPQTIEWCCAPQVAKPDTLGKKP